MDASAAAALTAASNEAGSNGIEKNYILGAYAAVGVTIVIAVLLTILIHAPALVTATGFTSFAVIYVVAQAIERFLQPMSEWAGQATKVENAETNLTLTRATSAGNEKEAEKKLASRKFERATFFWAAASCLALLVCSVLGLGLLQTVVEFSNKNVPGWFEAFDVVITGLAVGAGTKPLHDLISLIQKSKEG
jgi:hypothetical protein